jgi:hypothetical protein
MSASSAFASPLVRSVGGRDVEFSKLTMQDYGCLESAVRSKRVEIIKAVLEESEGVSPKDRLDAVRAEASRPVTMWDVDHYIGTAEGAQKALELSLRRAKHPDPKSVLGDLNIVDAYGIAGLALGILKLPEDAGPDPRRGGGGTGTPTPPSSESASPASTRQA